MYTLSRSPEDTPLNEGSTLTGVFFPVFSLVKFWLAAAVASNAAFILPWTLCLVASSTSLAVV